MNKKVLSLTAIMLTISITYSFYKVRLIKEPATEVNNAINKTFKYYSPYVGEEISRDTYNNIPFMAVIENSKSARPQSGLSEADIVYETMAEGGIPRFIALFQKNSPKEIGPIRSVRPYFIDISKEYDLPFVHCGGSEQALNYIKEESLMSMNELKNNAYFWRDQSRKAPHNLYTSSSKIRALVSSKSYVRSAKSALKFEENYWKESDLPTVSDLVIKLNKNYSTQYILEDMNYTKSMDGIQAVDRGNNKNIEVKNIIIQITDIRLQPDGSHIDIDIIGKGNGYVVSDGKYTKMNWSRKDLESPTLLVDEKGGKITLSPGKTWWHIIDNKANISFK